MLGMLGEGVGWNKDTCGWVRASAPHLARGKKFVGRQKNLPQRAPRTRRRSGKEEIGAVDDRWAGHPS